jgi:predicted dehydrogenase
MTADAVLNVTVPEAHAEVSITALLHGLAVLCEKPLADTLGRCTVHDRRLRGRRPTADGLAVPPLLAQPHRPTRAAGPAGPLGFVQCSFFKAPHFGGFREEMAYPLLGDMAIHQFDLARELIGS